MFRGTVRQRGGSEVDGEFLGFAHAEHELQLDFRDGLGRGQRGPAGDHVSAMRPAHEVFRDT